MRDFKYLSETLTLKFNVNKCNGCGACTKVCPHAVFSIVNKKAEPIRYNFCMECGACALNCTQSAISVVSGIGCGCATGIIEGFFKKKDAACSCSC